MIFNIQQLLWMFIIYAFAGWCTEVAYAAVNTGKFVNRGMLNGPICPIYGFGVLLVLLLLESLKYNLFFLFIGSVIVTSALEFMTGWVLEKVFHDKWWDYSDQPFNIKGYVCLKFSLAWGLACVFVVRIVHPSILFIVNKLDTTFGYVLLAIFWTVFLVDIVITLINLIKLPKRLQTIDDIEGKLHDFSDIIGNNIADGMVTAVEKEKAFRESELGRTLIEKNERLMSGLDALKEKSQEAVKLELNSQKEEIRNQMAELENEAIEIKKKYEAEMEKIYLKWDEAEKLTSMRDSLLSQRNRVHERFMLAFPNLQKGHSGEIMNKIIANREKRKNKRM